MENVCSTTCRPERQTISSTIIRMTEMQSSAETDPEMKGKRHHSYRKKLVIIEKPTMLSLRQIEYKHYGNI